MNRTYSVMYEPNDGSAAAVLVDAPTAEKACEYVLAWYHWNDMDAVTVDDLTATDLGMPSEIVYIEMNAGTFQTTTVKEDA